MKYQYKCESISGLLKTMSKMESAFQKKLDEYSNNGWELVDFQSWGAGTKIIIVFRREID